MADRARPVTANEAKAVVSRGAPCRFTVGNGLHLWVKGPGKAQWVLRYLSITHILARPLRAWRPV